jgi:hypothetical protein
VQAGAATGPKSKLLQAGGDLAACRRVSTFMHWLWIEPALRMPIGMHGSPEAVTDNSHCFLPCRNVSGTGICGPPLPASSHVVVGSGPLPKCKPSAACQKAPLTRSYAFTVTNTARTWGATRDTLQAALATVYKKYGTPYPAATKLGGPAGQGKSKHANRTTWRFTVTLSIGAKNQCKPRGAAMHTALRKALAIPGSSIKS